MTGEEKSKLGEGKEYYRPGASWPYDVTGGKSVRRSKLYFPQQKIKTIYSSGYET
jgi:hypothetical protein